MKMEMYSIHDELNEFMPMQGLPNDAVAERWFRELLETNTVMKMNQKHFDLYHMGTWDTKTGHYTEDIRIIPVNTKGVKNDD